MEEQLKPSEIKVITDYFNKDDFEKLINNPLIQDKYNECVQSGFKKTNFTMILPKSMQDTLGKQFSYFDSDTLREVPMRWVTGEVLEHRDYAWNKSNFMNSIVIYLNNDPTMLFTIHGNSHTIDRNKAFIFSHNLLHSVTNNNSIEFNKEMVPVPRLIMGPMNESAIGVGAITPYIYFNNLSDANSTTNAINSSYTDTPMLSAIEAGLSVPDGYTFNGWLAAPSSTGYNGFPNDQLYIAGQIYYDESYFSFQYYLYPSYTSPIINPYIIYGGGNSGGNFWYGNSTGFPGFLYKKNLGVGTRRSTNLGAAGNSIAPTAYLYNKYKPGSNGIGASTISNRRAKNRLASICGPTTSCGKFQPFLGRYPTYSYNPNGYFPYPPLPLAPQIPVDPNAQTNLASILFDGTQNYLTYPGVDLSGNSFTFECWFNSNVSFLSYRQTLIGATQNNLFSLTNGITIALGPDASSGGTSTAMILDRLGANRVEFLLPTIVPNTWYYLLYTRDATNNNNANAYLGVDGNTNAARCSSAQGYGTTWTGTDDTVYNVGTINNIGCWSQSGDYVANNIFDGYISNVRFTSTAFDPSANPTVSIPTAPFTSNSNTLLLLNTTSSLTTFIDSSPNNYTMTSVGSPGPQTSTVGPF